MATLKSPYSRKAAFGQGAAQGLSKFSNLWLENYFAQRRQENENKLVADREQQGRTFGAATTGAEDVRKGSHELSDYSPALQEIMKAFLPANPGPTQEERFASVTPKIGADTTDTQLQSLLDAAKVRTTPQLGSINDPSQPTDDGNMSLSSTKLQPVAAKPWEQAQAARQQVLDALKAKTERDITTKGREAFTTAYNTGNANEAVASENNDADLARAGQKAFTTTYNNNLANTNPDIVAAKVDQAGQTAGAEAAARFPWENKLNLSRAAVERATHIANKDYDNAHPATPAQVRNREVSAKDALSLIDQNQQLLIQMDKEGMMGPLKSRMAKIATGDVKSVQLVKQLFGSDPNDPKSAQNAVASADQLAKEAFPGDDRKAQLAAQYFGQMSYLQSLAAMVHGGQRGASSPNMLARFEKIIGSTGDTPIINSELTAIKNLMNIYAHNGEAPDLMVIPPALGGGGGKGDVGPILPNGKPSASDKLNKLREQDQ